MTHAASPAMHLVRAFDPKALADQLPVLFFMWEGHRLLLLWAWEHTGYRYPEVDGFV